MFTIFLVIACATLATAAVPADKIDVLPGYDSDLPSNHYSGYVPVGKLSESNGHLHYWFIEAENDPASAPVVLWLNGGPGSSSLIGLLTENGQLRTNDNSFANLTSSGIPQLFYNEYGWSKLTNMLYLESPKGVGFSYCDDATSAEECVNDDESTAMDAYEFLANWFELYPEYKTNKFYITGKYYTTICISTLLYLDCIICYLTLIQFICWVQTVLYCFNANVGESYAGIYIPMLMDQVDKDVLGTNINLVGAAIGNGCWGTTVGTCAHGVEQQEYASAFFYGHGMYSQKLRKEMLEACGDWSSLTEECSAKIDEMNDQLGDFDVYNVYDECGSDNRRLTAAADADGVQSPPRQSSWTEIAAVMGQKSVRVDTVDSFRVSAGYSGAVNDYTCGGHTAMNAYLAEPSVMAALHVLPDTVGMTYKKTCGDLLPLYSDLISKYQMLIYAGDTDGCVPYVGTEQWTRGLNYTVVHDWHQWLSKPSFEQGEHKAGYAVTFDKFQFVTVNGAGHMVPTFQPGFAYGLFSKFLNDEKF